MMRDCYVEVFPFLDSGPFGNFPSDEHNTNNKRKPNQ